MSANSGIEWTDHTFNPWWGCEKVSPACKHCYAETFSRRLGLDIWGGGEPRRFFGDKHWKEPLKWNASAERRGVRRRVFCASMADVFEDRRDLDEHRERLWGLIESTPSLDWLLLTKRPENHHLAPWNTRRHNVWLGCTAEDQEHAEKRIPHLFAESAIWPQRRFVSYEPALGPLDLGPWLGGLDWVIAGGESGAKARAMDESWVRSVRDQCQRAGVYFFYKQKLDAGRKVSLPLLDGQPWSECPP